MKTNYALRSDDDLCQDRIHAFMDDRLPIKDRRALNKEFMRRFPKMADNPNRKPAPDLPPWMTDETPEFPQIEVPEWQREPKAIIKKNLFFGKKKTTNSLD